MWRKLRKRPQKGNFTFLPLLPPYLLLFFLPCLPLLLSSLTLSSPFPLLSIRATYGTDTKMNAVHASDSHEVAARELAFFMPKYRLPYVPGTEPPIERTLALIRPSALAEHRGKH